MNALSRTATLIFFTASCALAQQGTSTQATELASVASVQADQQQAERAEQAEMRAKKEMREKLELLAATQHKVVTGKPYYATSATDIVQTLGDGNRIIQHSSSVIYRDSQGRTRREQTFPSFDGQP